MNYEVIKLLYIVEIPRKSGVVFHFFGEVMNMTFGGCVEKLIN